MSYNVTLNKKLPEQGVYDQLLGGHIVNRKQVKLYPRSGSGPFQPSGGQNTIQFRLPSHGYIDCLRSYMTYTLRVHTDVSKLPVNYGLSSPLVDLSAVNMSATAVATAMRKGIFDHKVNNTVNPAIASPNMAPLDYDPASLLSSGGVHRDSLAYILGGHNGSSASPFKLFRFLYDGEPIEYIDNYNGLAALLSMNISEGYRRSALGNMQFLSPRGPREMILNALSRGGNECLTSGTHNNAQFRADERVVTPEYGWNGQPANSTKIDNGIKSRKGDMVTTAYKDLLHMPLSGILGNSKLLPAKFAGNMDIELELDSYNTTLQVASSFAVNTLVSTHVGAVITGPQKLTFKRSRHPLGNTSASNTVSVTKWGDYLTDTEIASGVLAYVENVLANIDSDDRRVGDDFVLKQTVLDSVRYDIMDPVYHMEVVYMSEAYDAAFADALTRGVTYSYETYTATNAPVQGDGAIHVPISKTSIKGAFAGFINNSVRGSKLANSWHFFNPDLKEWQCKFGAKLVPQEPMVVDDDKGLQSLMMYLKAVNMHYNPMAGFHYNWVRSDTSQQKTHGPLSGESNSTVAFGTLGCAEPGQATWCYNSGDIQYGDNDLKRVFDNFPSTFDVANSNKYAPNNDWIAGHSMTGGYAMVGDHNNLQHSLAVTTWEYNIGSFAIGVDLETEQDALSGINTAGSTAALQWVFKFVRAPRSSQISLYTWVLHDKALRFEPFGRASVIVD